MTAAAGTAFVQGGGGRTLLRRRINDLSPEDVDRLRAAFEGLIKLGNADDGYFRLAGIHGAPGYFAQNHTDLFLPWNRAFLVYFERALGEQGFNGGLPWWDWSSPDAAQRSIPPAFAEETIDGRPNVLHSVEIPEGGRPDGAGDPKRTFREPGQRLDDAADLSSRVESILALNDFRDFSQQLENMHDYAHVSVGGTLGIRTFGAYDPLSWLLEANVDRLWRLWQIRHPDVALPERLLDQALPPFPTTVSDVVEVEALGYDYDLAAALPALVVGAAGARSDRPTREGGLGFEQYAAAFATLIQSPLTEPPVTIGIYGSWGAGKSSLLEQIALRVDPEFGQKPARRKPLQRLRTWLVNLRDRRRHGPRGAAEEPADAPRRVHVVSFNAWDYSASDVIWPALVRKTMDSLERRAPVPWRTKVWRRLRRNTGREWRRNHNRLLAAAVVAVPIAVLAIARLDFSAIQVSAALIGLAAAGTISIVGKAISNPLSRWLATMLEDADYGRETDLMSEIREDLGFLDERLGERTRLLILIDDLDRCEPDRAVEVLQAVNLLLNSSRFVVCLGIDARIVTAAVEAHYQGLLDRAGASGYEYLDKIIQIPFRIPEPTPTDLETFLEREVPVVVAPLAGDGVQSDVVDDVQRPTQSADADYGASLPSELGAAAAAEELKQEAPFEQDELLAFVEISAFLRPNPRHIKRLINVYRLVRTLGGRANQRTLLERRTAVIRWLAVSAQWPYTAFTIVRQFERLPPPDRVGLAASPKGLLVALLEQAQPLLDRDRQRKLDDDLDRLKALLGDPDLRLAADEFHVIHRYTINFNPAVAEIPVGTAEPPASANAKKPRAVTAAGHRRAQLLALVTRFPNITIGEAAKLLDAPAQSIARAATALEREGVVTRRNGGLAVRAARKGRNVKPKRGPAR